MYIQIQIDGCVCWSSARLCKFNGLMRDKHVHAVLSIQIGRRRLCVVQSGSYNITGVHHIHRVCGVWCVMWMCECMCVGVYRVRVVRGFMQLVDLVLLIKHAIKWDIKSCLKFAKKESSKALNWIWCHMCPRITKFFAMITNTNQTHKVLGNAVITTYLLFSLNREWGGGSHYTIIINITIVLH